MPRKSTFENLPSRVNKFIVANHLARPGEKWLVGVSGGPDSVCLLHILCQIQEEMGIFLYVVHLNHSLRGEAAETDALYVTSLAHMLKVPITSGQRDVLDFKKQHHSSLEEAAREVRYLFFHEEALAHQADKVALAHTADDQAETVLLHLIRGSGSRGLKGMTPLEKWHSSVTGASITVVRPLLEVSRTETESYCKVHRLKPRYDITNRSPEFLRNRLRSEVLPLLTEFNPRIRETLTRTGRLVSQELEALETLVSPLVARLLQVQDGQVLVDIKGMLAHPPGIQRFLLRSAWTLLKGDLRDLEAQHIEKMRRALGGGTGKGVSLPGNTSFVTEYGTAILGAATPPLSTAHPLVKLAVPGETVAMGYRLRTRLTSPLEVDFHLVNPFKVYLDSQGAGRDLLVRSRLPGDRFRPLGMSEDKKIQDFMVDTRIPRRLRDSLPLVCSPEHILWIVGFRIDDRVKVTDKSTEVLVVEAEPIEGRVR